MIMIFGPAGAGKSTQAELLAAKMGRKALSVGQICREQFADYAKTGDMVPQSQLAKAVMSVVESVEATGSAVVLDGQPWNGNFLADMQSAGMLQAIEIAFVLDVPRAECLARLAARGRSDDRTEVWHKKLDMYENQITTFLSGLQSRQILVTHIDGQGSVDKVNQRIIRQCDALND